MAVLRLVAHLFEVTDGLAHGTVVDQATIVEDGDEIKQGEDLLSTLVDGKNRRHVGDVGGDAERLSVREGGRGVESTGRIVVAGNLGSGSHLRKL